MKCSTYPIEKNYMVQYAKLWDKINNEQFTFNDIRNSLPEGSTRVRELIIKLRQNGWLSVLNTNEKTPNGIFQLHRPIDIMINISETVEREINLIRKINDVPDEMKIGGRIVECPVCEKQFKYYCLHPPKCCSEECYIQLRYFRKDNFKY
jgi:hypothetical protein